MKNLKTQLFSFTLIINFIITGSESSNQSKSKSNAAVDTGSQNYDFFQNDSDEYYNNYLNSLFNEDNILKEKVYEKEEDYESERISSSSSSDDNSDSESDDSEYFKNTNNIDEQNIIVNIDESNMFNELKATAFKWQIKEIETYTKKAKESLNNKPKLRSLQHHKAMS